MIDVRLRLEKYNITNSINDKVNKRNNSMTNLKKLSTVHYSETPAKHISIYYSESTYKI